MPLSILQLRDIVIKEGIEEIRTVRYPEHKERGAIAGFERCRTLVTFKEYEDLIRERRKWEISFEGSVEEYWEHRMATVQIEFVFEIMRIAWRKPGPYSGRAMLCYFKHMQPEDYDRFMANILKE